MNKIIQDLNRALDSGHAGSAYVAMIERPLKQLIQHYREELESLGISEIQIEKELVSLIEK